MRRTRGWRSASTRGGPVFAAFVLVTCVASAVFAKPPAAPPKPKAKPTGSTTAPPAPPPPAPMTPEEAEAKRHFEIGLKLYAEKVYDGALIEFDASYKLNPRPSALRNIAQCHRDLKHFALAHDAYEKLLDQHLAQLSQKEKDAIGKALTELRILTGTLDVSVNEAGATIELDGRLVGVTPLAKPFRADIGTHKLRVTKDAFDPFEKDVTTIAKEAQSLTVTLTAQVTTGHVAVREEGGIAVHVFIDDVDEGPAPWAGDLSAGPHVIQLKADGVASQKRTIDVVVKQNADVALAALALRGKLRVQSLGAIGDISIDGKKVGTGTWEGELAPGTYEVSVVAAGYEPYKHLVVVDKGRTVIEPVTLAEKNGSGVGGNPFRGLYAKFNLVGVFPLAGGPTLGTTCSESGLGSCSNNGIPFAAGTKLNVGYSWDVFGLELASAFLFDVPYSVDRTFGSSTSAPPTAGSTITDAVERKETHKFKGWAVFAGPGARITSKDDAVRFTFGLAVGGVYRSFGYERDALGDKWAPSDVTKFAPAMMVDAGLLLGGTPGTKFTLGVMAWAEMTGTVQTEDGGLRNGKFGNVAVKIASPPQTLADGVHFYLGPTIGLQFGR